jgi:hypothetical protein
MAKSYSLQIKEIFLINGRGLVVIPILQSPRISGFKPFSQNVILMQPDGKEKIFSAKFELVHFSLAGGIGRWEIILLFTSRTKKDFPEGSEIIVTEDIFFRLEFNPAQIS